MKNRFIPSYTKIHPSFQWQGKSIQKEELSALAQEYLGSKEEYIRTIGEFFSDWLDENELIKVKTSGSTGKPKEIWVKKQYMVNSAVATGKFFELPAQTSALLCLPASYIAGKLMLVRAMILGWYIDSVPPQASPLSVTGKHYHFTALTPYQLDKSVEYLDRVDKIIVGGGKVAQSLKERIQNTPTKIFETYGMTETLTHIAARQINTPKNPNPPFEIMENVSIRQDERECLVISAPKVSDIEVVTNDLVNLESKTTFRLRGRIDNIINSGGIKILPEEVEAKLSGFIHQRFFVAGIPDDALGEKLVLYVEDTFSSEKELQILEFIQKAYLAKYEKPKEIVFVDKFRETHTGKVLRSPLSS